MERVGGRCGRMRVRSVAAFVVVGEEIGRRRSGIDVAKRMIRIQCAGDGSMDVGEEVGGIFQRVDECRDGGTGGQRRAWDSRRLKKTRGFPKTANHPPKATSCLSSMASAKMA